MLLINVHYRPCWKCYHWKISIKYHADLIQWLHDFCNRMKSSDICLHLHLEPSFECIGRDVLIEFPISKGPYFHLCHPICPPLVLSEKGTHFLCGCKELLQAGYSVGQGFHISPDFCCHPCSKWFQAKLLLCSLAREVSSALCCGSLRCAITSLTFMSLTLTRVLCCSCSIKFFFLWLCCYDFSSNERTTWEISAICCLFFLVECIKLSIACVFVCKCCVVPHSLFLSDIGVRYCELVFVWVPQVCEISYVHTQWLQNKPLE